jgi:serine/threonine-protein kinase
VGIVGGEAESGRDLARRLEEALARFGVAGNVAVTSGVATLHGNGPTVSAELGGLVGEWHLLPEEARTRHVSAVARRLSSERRAVSSLAPAARSTFPAWVRPLALVVVIALAGMGLIRGYEYWAAGRGEAAARAVSRDYDGYERERAARAARVCDATRSRIMRGAAVGPSDAEGWLVELWALRAAERPSPALEPALGDFVSAGTAGAKGRLVWTGARLLQGRDGPDTSVDVSEANLPETGAPGLRGVRLTFTGRLVPPYFEDTPRLEYQRFARALTDAIGADYGALYAHCAGNGAHHLGSWFRGPSPGGAATSLVYFMGAFGERPELRRSLLVQEGATSPDLWYAFQSVSHATGSLRKGRVMNMISTELGMIAGLDDRVSTITFPFRDANRATRAAHSMARELGISEAK